MGVKGVVVVPVVTLRAPCVCTYPEVRVRVRVRGKFGVRARGGGGRGRGSGRGGIRVSVMSPFSKSLCRVSHSPSHGSRNGHMFRNFDSLMACRVSASVKCQDYGV